MGARARVIDIRIAIKPQQDDKKRYTHFIKERFAFEREMGQALPDLEIEDFNWWGRSNVDISIGWSGGLISPILEKIEEVYNKHLVEMNYDGPFIADPRRR